MFVAFDTETTGIFDFKKPADDPSQPRLASLAMIWTDSAGREVDRKLMYVKPAGWEMTQEAFEVNGLTTDFLRENGTDIGVVLDVYERAIRSNMIMAAYNVQFDCKMMRGEFRRAGRDDLFEITLNTCLMRGLKPYKEKGLAIKGGQFVKLSVACEFFGITHAEAHEAMSDAEAARAILQILIEDGNLIPPAVHYAKSKPAA